MKYRLSQVQSARDDRVAFAGVAFNIVNERGAPIVTFGFLDQSKATNARALIEKAIVDAALIAPRGCRRANIITAGRTSISPMLQRREPQSTACSRMWATPVESRGGVRKVMPNTLFSSSLMSESSSAPVLA